VVARGHTAVVADDLPLVRLGLVAALRLADVRTVAQADRLDEAVAAARHATATLLLVGSATDATAAALGRHRPGLGATHVVVLVGHAERATLVSLLEAGADGVVLRSIAPEDLAGVVRRVLAGERGLDPALLSVLVGLDQHANGSGGPSSAAGPAPAGLPGAAVPTGPGGSDPTVPLTGKEQQVLARLARGDSNAEIADALYISSATVKTHLTHIYAKLGVGSRHEATSRAVALGLLR
jgi:DNA-binding NarL/FixJ family response regulator